MGIEVSWNRREFLMATTAVTVIGPALLAADPQTKPTFRLRGYYTIATRYPTAGLAVWKNILDCMQKDGCNLLIHWVAGSFKSVKFPETWQYNREHENIQSDFTREMIDYAHMQGIRVLLGFTPFGYDGVNRYSSTHPELTSVTRDGKPAAEFGISCWGRSLCPSKEQSQAFMLDYTREMFFDFYPNADGIFFESSDYSTCFCEKCGLNGGAGHFESEFRYVKTISDEIWKKKPDATMVVYPHYFSGDGINTNDGKAKAAQIPFDERWTLFFTPHSTELNADLIGRAKDSIWWDPQPIFGTPESVRNGAMHARHNKFTGYVPSLEAYSFLPTRNESEPWTATKRQVPFGIGWVPNNQSPYDELPIRSIRIAYREFSRNPDLPIDAFRQLLGHEIFGDSTTEQKVSDLLLLQRSVTRDRDWTLPSPITEPLRVKWFAESGQLSNDRKSDLKRNVESLRLIAKRYAGGKGAEAEMARAAQWISDQWTGANAQLLGLEESN